MQAWWGNAASAEAEITLAMSSETALCRIVECDGAADRLRATRSRSALWGERAAAGDAGRAPGTSICSSRRREHRGRALGRARWQLLAEEVFATTLAVACCGVVSIRNETAVRAYERAGFRWLRIWPRPVFGPCWLMLKERPVRRRPLSWPAATSRRETVSGAFAGDLLERGA